VVNPVADMDGDRFLADHFSSGIACRRQRGQRRGFGSGIRVFARWADMQVKGVSGQGKRRRESEAEDRFYSAVGT